MYESNNFNPDSKLFYRPIDAAIRWCELINYERQILDSTWVAPDHLTVNFPQWPCLQDKLEKILDAIRNQDLRYGALGVTVRLGTPVDFRFLTIRHSDLKWWMLRHYPDQRPSFLFNSSTENHDNISYRTYLTLQADRDALRVRVRDAEATINMLMSELKAAGLERENLRLLAENKADLSDQSKASFLIVIGALVNLILGSSEAGRRHSIFDSQASIVDSITAHYGGVPGLSKRSLDEKFAAGRRSIAQARR